MSPAIADGHGEDVIPIVYSTGILLWKQYHIVVYNDQLEAVHISDDIYDTREEAFAAALALVRAFNVARRDAQSDDS